MQNDDDRERFNAITRFLRNVIDDDTATLEIPQAANEINVRRQGRLLPLEHLGTGVAQVVILAAAASLHQQTLICMEEPEVHLHPLLQRKLLRYLYNETDNQYLIATHSAHLLDSKLATVFHATYTEKGTQVVAAGNPAQLSAVCVDLGYRPSDLLQTNCVIWVEGPSDRIYLVHWISFANPKLRENIDYSIMFYGGRLLNYLTPEDPEVRDFISLRRLNRYLAVVMDSDKSSARSRVGETKKRIREMMKDPGIAWITNCRYIESYVPPDELSRALRACHPRITFVPSVDRWADVMRPAGPDDKRKADKIKVAKYVTARWESGLHHHDLHARVSDLVHLIEAANGLAPTNDYLKAPPKFVVE